MTQKSASRKNQSNSSSLSNALMELVRDLKHFENETGREVEREILALCSEYTKFESLGKHQQSLNILNKIEKKLRR